MDAARSADARSTGSVGQRRRRGNAVHRWARTCAAGAPATRRSSTDPPGRCRWQCCAAAMVDSRSGTDGIVVGIEFVGGEPRWGGRRRCRRRSTATAASGRTGSHAGKPPPRCRHLGHDREDHSRSSGPRGCLRRDHERRRQQTGSTAARRAPHRHESGDGAEFPTVGDRPRSLSVECGSLERRPLEGGWSTGADDGGRRFTPARRRRRPPLSSTPVRRRLGCSIAGRPQAGGA